MMVEKEESIYIHYKVANILTISAHNSQFNLFMSQTQFPGIKLKIQTYTFAEPSEAVMLEPNCVCFSAKCEDSKVYLTDCAQY